MRHEDILLSVFVAVEGALVAGVTKNALPVVMACLTAAGMSAVYEVTARRALADGTKAPAWGV